MSCDAFFEEAPFCRVLPDVSRLQNLHVVNDLVAILFEELRGSDQSHARFLQQLLQGLLGHVGARSWPAS